MTPIQLGVSIIDQTMQHLLPAKYDSVQARVLLLAIGLQESQFLRRAQIGGPARSFWQEEQGGSIHGVLTSPATRLQMRAVCQLRVVAPIESDVYGAVLTDDLLGCAVARLVLWADPNPLPVLGDVAAAWACYDLRAWRPGKPRPHDWPTNYAAALAAVTHTMQAT